MNTTKVLVIGIVFLLVGLILCFLAYKAKSTKAAHMIFNIIGSVTSVMGLMAIVMHSSITKLAIEIAGLIYLVFLIVIMSIFNFMIKGLNKDERDDTQR